MEDFYELLGVSEDASTDEIDRAWRERVHRYHPDVNDDARANAQFKTLKTAHEVLSDEAERAAYDRLGHETYVRERLEGLPTAHRPSAGGAAGTDRDPPGGDGPGADAGRSDPAGAADGSTTGGPGGGGRRDIGSTGPSGTNRGGRAGDRRGRGGADTQAATTPTEERTRPRRPLAYGWAGIAAVSVVYLLGLWAYLGRNAAAFASLTELPPAAVPPTLVRSYDLLAPGTFVLDAAAAGAVLPLVFAAGAVGVAVGFVAVVASFGRGTAYLYVAGGLAPVASLAIGPVVTAPDGATLALVVVVPGATIGLFLADVGRALLGGR